MKHFLVLNLIVASSLVAANLYPTGDFEGVTTSWKKFLQTGTTAAGTLTFQGTEVHAGAKAAQFEVTAASTENWHAQLQFPTVTLEAGKVYTLTFWAKGDASIHVGVSNQAYDYLTGFTFSLTPQWKLYSGTVIGDGTLRRINAYVGLATGNYYFDDIALEEIGSLDPAWYSKANERIETNRKKDFGLRVLDAQGVPTASQSVSVKLLRHTFPFGTALAFYGNADDEWYKETAAKYFWAGVLENDFKWPSYEADQGVLTDTKVESYLDWTESQGWTLMRGHALEWGIEQYGYDQHWPRLGTREQYLVALKTRIQRDMLAYKGRFQQYDVWNEVFHEPAIFDKWGWDLLDSALIWARAADPTAKLFINEYSVVAGGETERLYQIIADLQKRSIPVDGIGVQCHFFSQEIDPSTIAMRLDRLAGLGLPIVVTEFDLGSMNDGMTLTEAAQASEMAEFVRTVYSHPAVEGIILWGFWDNRHWIDNGGIFRVDKTPKPAADSLYSLWHTTWTTQANLTTNAEGIAGFRGFPGVYEVTYGTVKDTLEFNTTVQWDLKMGAAPVGIRSQVPFQLKQQGALLRLNGQRLGFQTAPQRLVTGANP